MIGVVRAGEEERSEALPVEAETWEQAVAEAVMRIESGGGVVLGVTGVGEAQ